MSDEGSDYRQVERHRSGDEADNKAGIEIVLLGKEQG